jgi:transcriptional regulator with XRE-family HTH domain
MAKLTSEKINDGSSDLNPIKKLRKEKGLSGYEMALILGLYNSYYYALEKGAINLSDKMAQKISEYFGVDKEKLKKEFEEWITQKKEKLLKDLEKEK